MKPFTLEDHEKRYGEHVYGYVRYGESWRSIVEKYAINAVDFKHWCYKNKIRINDDESIKYMTTNKAVDQYKKWKERREYEKIVTKFDENLRAFARRKKKVKLRDLTIEERVKLNNEYEEKVRMSRIGKDFMAIYGVDKKQLVNYMYRTGSKPIGQINEKQLIEQVDKFKEHNKAKELRKDKKNSVVITNPEQKKNKWKVEYKKLGKPMVIYIDVKTDIEARKYCINNYNISEKAIRKVEYV